jgi:hypothetical protein
MADYADLQEQMHRAVAMKETPRDGVWTPARGLTDAIDELEKQLSALRERLEPVRTRIPRPGPPGDAEIAADRDPMLEQASPLGKHVEVQRRRLASLNDRIADLAMELDL